MKVQKSFKTQFLMKLSPLALMLVISSSGFTQENDYKGDPIIEKSTQTDKEYDKFDKTYADEDFKREKIEPITLKPIGIKELAPLDSLRVELPVIKKIELKEIDKSKVEVTKIETETEEKKEEVKEVTETDPEVKDIVKVDSEELKAKIESLKKELEAKKDEISSLQTSISDIKVESEKAKEEIDSLNEVVDQRTTEISSLQSQISDLKVQIEQDTEAKAALETQIAELENQLEEAKKLIAEKETENAKLLEEKETQDALIAEKDELIESLEGRNSDLETITCEQEDRLAKLEQQVTGSSMNAMMPILMQQQMMMTQMMMSMMNSGFPMGMAPSLADGSQSLRMEMLAQSMRYENQISNLQNNMYGMFGMMNSIRPTYQIGGDYIAGNYSAMSGLTGNNPLLAQQNLGQANPALAYNTPYSPFLNTDERVGITSSNFGNMASKKAPVDPKKKTTVATTTDKNADADLTEVGLGG